MDIPNRVLLVLVCCSVGLNVYQYQQEKTFIIKTESEQSNEQINEQHAHNLTSSERTCETQLTTIKATFNNNLANTENIETEELQGSNKTEVAESIYPEGYFEAEFVKYLDDDLVYSLENSEEESKLKIIELLNNTHIRQQDIELESNINQLLAKYSESVQEGSKDINCNSLGCYVSYTLTDTGVYEHILVDSNRVYPSGNTGFGKTLNNSDGTTRYVDFSFSP